MERNWTTVGAALSGTMEMEEGTRPPVKDFRPMIERAIESINWREIPKGGTLEAPMMPGEGIKSAISALRIPKVSHVAWTNELAPYGFYGIRGHYKNGDADVFIVDTGTKLVPVCSDFEPKTEVPS